MKFCWATISFSLRGDSQILAGWLLSVPDRGKDVFPLSRPDRRWGPICLLCAGCWWLSPVVKLQKPEAAQFIHPPPCSDEFPLLALDWIYQIILLLAPTATVSLFFICGLFNDASSSSVCLMSNDMVISEKIIWKWSWPNLSHYPGIYLEGLKKIKKTIVRVAVNVNPESPNKK
jgi:hypothetical protein